MLLQIAPIALVLAAAFAPLGDEEEKAPELDYSAFASRFREAHDAAGAMPGSLSLQDFLNSDAFRKFSLGMLDIRVPAEALLKRKTAQMFADSALAVLDAQSRWVDWVAFDHEDYPVIAEDFHLLHNWVASWSTSSLATIGRYPERDVMQRLGGTGKTLEAHRRVEEFMSRGDYLGIARSDAPDTQVVFAHNRTWMLELLCFTGWNTPDRRHQYWKKGIEKWTSFWNEETQVIAMDYPAYPLDMKNPERGADMNEYEKTGLGQHASEKIAASMFWRYFGNNDALFYEAALGTTLSISIYDENNVRTGAPVFKNSGGSTQAYSVFVPGGNSAGGTLPGRGAISIIETPLWRETKGSDYYVKPLNKAQKKGGKLAKKDRHPNKDKRAHFILAGEKDGDRSFVTAPFFGAAAQDKDLPAKEYLVDYEEFFRVYRASFFHWVQTRGAGKNREENAAKFRQLNLRLATRDSTTSFAFVLEEIYGLPLSAPDGESDSLEWQFLTYISKGGR